MNDVVGGLLLPQSVLSSTWFSVLATVVAFNTLVYIGLTLSKLAPLPKPARTASVRRWLGKFGITIDEEVAMKALPETTWTESDDPHELMRTTVAKRYIPTGLIVLGGLTTVLSLITLATDDSGDRQLVELAGLALGLAVLIASQVVIRSSISVAGLRWLWSVSNILVAAALIVDSVYSGNQSPLSYLLILLVGFPSLTMAWYPSVVGSCLILAGLIGGAWGISGGEDYRIAFVSVVAAFAGLGLLRLRLLAVDSLADETVAANALATTDLATSMLTRNGLQTLMPALGGIADRMESNVCVIYLEIDQLGEANKKYGIDYGNSVLKIVAEAIAVNVRSGDLVARYAGDAFVIAGLGDKPDAHSLSDRIEATIASSGHALGRIPIRTNVGTAAGSATSETFEALVREAKAASKSARGIAGHS